MLLQNWLSKHVVSSLLQSCAHFLTLSSKHHPLLLKFAAHCSLYKNKVNVEVHAQQMHVLGMACGLQSGACLGGLVECTAHVHFPMHKRAPCWNESSSTKQLYEQARHQLAQVHCSAEVLLMCAFQCCSPRRDCLVCHNS
jgi:hypothetical protein